MIAFEGFAIQGLVLPRGWVDLPERPALSDLHLTSFCRSGRAEVTISFALLGRGILPDSRRPFRALLEAAVHSVTPQDLASLGLLLRNLADHEAFEPARAATRDLGGRRVLEVEGLWRSSRLLSTSLFFGAGPGVSHLFEIHFVAPSTDYHRHRASLREAIDRAEFTPPGAELDLAMRWEEDEWPEGQELPAWLADPGDAEEPGVFSPGEGPGPERSS